MKYNKKKKIMPVSGVNIFIDKNIKGIINFFCFNGAERGTNYFNNESKGDEINILIKIVSPDYFLPEKKDNLVNFSKYYRVGRNQVYYFRKILFFKLGLSFKKVSEKTFCFSVTTDYLRFVKLRIGNLCSLGVHLLYLLMIETIKKGNLILYGGAFLNTQSNIASLIIAPSGVGKTQTLLKLIEDKSFKLLSEEDSYLDFSNQELNFICVPNTIFNINKNKKKGRFFDFLFDFLFVKKDKTILEVLGPEIFSRKGTAKRIYLLENSKSDSIEKVPNNEENLRKVTAIQHLRFSNYWNELLCAYSYYGNLDMNHIYKKDEALLREFFSRVELFIVKASSFEKFSQLIRSIEKK
ncbi:MAG: hypothetical protein PHN56_02725 [Candidatus Nanoarchaeia archaeon]|nr:hypothetical protein [Candidatus Nanoarchaeia archaeon]